MNKFRSQINTLGVFIVGSIGQNLISNIMEAKDKAKDKSEAIQRHKELADKVDDISTRVDKFKEITDKQLSECSSKKVSEEALEAIGTKYKSAFEDMRNVDALFEKGRNSTDLQQKVAYYDEAHKMYVDKKCSDKLQGLTDNLDKLLDESRKSLVSNYNLDSLYEYLNSLTLLEEYALFHIVALILIVSYLLNILFAILGNEIIDYFKLEDKYPKLHGFLRLRLRFQKYYLILSFSVIFMIILFILLINLIVLY